MRVGLVGTGHWAAVNHAPVLATLPDLEFSGVWGRNLGAARELADRFGVPYFDSYAEFLEAVDVVDFCVPPTAQAKLAIEAAEAGKHLLLEKPMAMTAADADLVNRAVVDSGSAALVFFTARFRPEIQEWLATVTAGDWTSANGEWITAALFDADSPWSRSSWRWEYGALWDLGPHVLSLLLPILGAVTTAHSVRGRGDLIHLTLVHEAGRTSALSFSLRAPAVAQRETLSLWGLDGYSHMPVPRTSSQDALRLALMDLTTLINTGRRNHPCDLRLGRDVVRILEAADSRKPENVTALVPR